MPEFAKGGVIKGPGDFPVGLVRLHLLECVLKPEPKQGGFVCARTDAAHLLAKHQELSG